MLPGWVKAAGLAAGAVLVLWYGWSAALSNAAALCLLRQSQNGPAAAGCLEPVIHLHAQRLGPLAQPGPALELQARLLLAAGRLTAAEQLLRTAQVWPPRDAVLVTPLGAALARDRRWATLRELLPEADGCPAPPLVNHLIALAEEFEQQQAWGDGYAARRAAFWACPEAGAGVQALLESIALARARGDQEQARETYALLATSKAVSGPMLADYAMLLWEMGRYAEAEAAAERAAARSPEYAGAYAARGFARFALGNWPGTIADLKRSAELNPGYSVSNAWLLVQAYRRAGWLPEVVAALEDLLAHDPMFQPALDLVAELQPSR